MLDGILEREGKPCYVVVLSDVALLCQVITLPQPPQIDGLFSITHQVDLGNCIISDFSEEGKLAHIEIGEIGEELHLLRCSGTEEKEKWYTIINAAINNYFGGVEAGLGPSLSSSSSALPPPPNALPPPPAALPPAPLSPSPRRPNAALGGGATAVPRRTNSEKSVGGGQPGPTAADEVAPPPTLSVTQAVSPAVGRKADATKSGARPPVAPRNSRIQTKESNEPPPVAPRQQRHTPSDERSPTPEKAAPPVAPRRPSEERAPSPAGRPLGSPVPSPLAAPPGLAAAVANSLRPSTPPPSATASPGAVSDVQPSTPPTTGAVAGAGANSGGLGGGLASTSKGSKKMNFTKSVSKKMMKSGSKSSIPKGVDVAALAAGSESEVIKVLMAQMEQEKKLRSEAEAKVALLEGRLAGAKGKGKAPAVSGSVTDEFCSHINKLTQMVDDLTTRNQVLELEVQQLRKQLQEKA